MTPAEQAFNDVLSVLSEHIAQASQFWYAGSSINELSKQPNVVQAMHGAAGFWICARRALEDQAIVSVGKIFGHRGANPTNIDRFFEVLRASRTSVFSKNAIEDRKRRDTQLTDEQIKRFMKSARALRASDVNRLHTVSKRHRRIYENQFAAIRNRHIAHFDFMTAAERNAMSARTHIPDLEKLLVFLNQFRDAIRASYYDGRAPVLRRMRWSVRSLVASDLSELSRTPDHEFAVIETRKAMDFYLAGVKGSRG
jgi:hypothetical protein